MSVSSERCISFVAPDLAVTIGVLLYKLDTDILLGQCVIQQGKVAILFEIDVVLELVAVAGDLVSDAEIVQHLPFDLSPRV